MRNILVCLLLLLCCKAGAQSVNCPPNIDFEEGTFNHWDCFTGTTYVAAGNNNVISLNPSPPVPGRHEIISSASPVQLDPYGNFPTLCPYGGAYSVKLGNNGSGSEAEGVSYTFQIPPLADTFSLTYYYAVVFEDPNHAGYEQPRFFVSAYDVLTGNLIHCASYNYISNGSIPGFQVSPNHSGVLYKDWTPSSIDFSGLAGRQVRLEFKTADCTLGAHFGYAYLDVATGCGGVIAAGAYCVETSSVTLSAPYGFQTYTWYNSNYSAQVGNARIVTISPPPPANSLFHVDMIPYPGYGCRDTADAVLTVLSVPDTPVAVTNIYYCQGDFPTKLTATGAPAHELLWYNVPVGGAPLAIAPTPSTTVPGVFSWYVSQKTFFGCESVRKKITVTVSPIPVVSFTVNDLRQCESINNFLFSSTSTGITAASIYNWDFGDGATSALPVVSHVYSGTGSHSVTLKINNTPSCFRQTSKTIDVVAKPVAAFSYPPLICENQTPILLQDNSYMPGGVYALTSWQWQVGNNTASGQVQPAFLYPGGTLPVKLVVFNSEGCRSDTAVAMIPVHYSPIPSFSFGPLLCDNEFISFRDRSVMPAGAGNETVFAWQWSYDNVAASVLQHPSALFVSGTHHVKLVAASNLGCNYRDADSVFTIHSKPAMNVSISDSCVRRNVLFTASNNSSIAVSKWFWQIGGNLREGALSETRYFQTESSFPLMLIGESAEKCRDTVIRPYTVYRNRSHAVRDTIAAMDEVISLGGGDTANVISYAWTPLTGLNNGSSSNPLALYDKDIVYHLATLTLQGCESYSKVNIRRYDGPEMYVPSAFSPNGDGLNDLLHILPAGIKEFKYFVLYNRRGEKIFSTQDFHRGWDGRFNGSLQEIGNYVWMAMGVDYRGKTIFKKGNVLLLK